MIADISSEQAQGTAAEIEKLGVKATGVGLDVSKAEEVNKVFGEIAKDYGKIDILVNNAGITRDGLIMRMKEEDWDAVININLKSVFLCSKEAVKVMAKQRYGRIINISSVVAFMGNPGQANYSASKAGIVGLTKTTAKEYASRGITAKCSCAGLYNNCHDREAMPENVKESHEEWRFRLEGSALQMMLQMPLSFSHHQRQVI